MAKPGRKRTAENTVLVQLTLPKEVDQAIENIMKTGFYGRSKSEVVVTLLSREFERFAREALVPRLADLAGH